MSLVKQSNTVIVNAKITKVDFQMDDYGNLHFIVCIELGDYAPTVHVGKEEWLRCVKGLLNLFDVSRLSFVPGTLCRVERSKSELGKPVQIHAIGHYMNDEWVDIPSEGK